jgi:small subunit ribosomal protein S9
MDPERPADGGAGRGRRIVVEKTEIHSASGRRRTAVAHVTLKPGSGGWNINHRGGLEAYFHSEALVGFIKQPLLLTNTLDKFDVTARCSGGGIVGQAGALRHGLARALILFDVALRAALKKSGFLTRDPRMKERKKPGQPGARKRFQFSKR